MWPSARCNVVCICAGMLDTLVSPAKTNEPIAKPRDVGSVGHKEPRIRRCTRRRLGSPDENWRVLWRVHTWTCPCPRSIFNMLVQQLVAFSALTLSVGRQEEHPACKNWVVGCWCGYLSGARCRLFAYGPGDWCHCHPQTPSYIVSFTSRRVLGPTFLVPVYPAYMLSWKRGRETGGACVCVSAATSYWLLSATYTYGCLQSHAVAGRGLTQSARSRLRNSVRHVPRHRRGHAVRKYTLHDNAAANSTLSRVAYSKSDHIDRVVTS